MTVDELTEALYQEHTSNSHNHRQTKLDESNGDTNHNGIYAVLTHDVDSELIDYALKVDPDNRFASSVKSQFQRTGHISMKQRSVLKAIIDESS